MVAMSYGSIYVARIAFGADDRQTVQALLEAEAYDGPSLIIAYSHCIAHGYDLQFGLQQQQAAVKSAYWPLYRYNPERALADKNPFVLDSKPPRESMENYAYREGRYRMLTQSHPEMAERLMELAKEDVAARWLQYEEMAKKTSA